MALPKKSLFRSEVLEEWVFGFLVCPRLAIGEPEYRREKADDLPPGIRVPGGA